MEQNFTFETDDFEDEQDEMFDAFLRIMSEELDELNSKEQKRILNQHAYDHAMTIGNWILDKVREIDEDASYEIETDPLFGTSLGFNISCAFLEGNKKDNELLDLVKLADAWDFSFNINQEQVVLSLTFNNVYTLYIKDDDGEYYTLDEMIENIE